MGGYSDLNTPCSGLMRSERRGRCGRIDRPVRSERRARCGRNAGAGAVGSLGPVSDRPSACSLIRLVSAVFRLKPGYGHIP